MGIPMGIRGTVYMMGTLGEYMCEWCSDARWLNVDRWEAVDYVCELCGSMNTYQGIRIKEGTLNGLLGGNVWSADPSNRTSSLVNDDVIEGLEGYGWVVEDAGSEAVGVESFMRIDLVRAL